MTWHSIDITFKVLTYCKVLFSELNYLLCKEMNDLIWEGKSEKHPNTRMFIVPVNANGNHGLRKR